MENLPFVSVIVPVYNAESTISTALEALLRQDYPQKKMEIIVVDDGSTDRSREIISRYPVKLVLHEKNKGDSAARNTGARNASGEILMTTDADDRADDMWVINMAKSYEDPDIAAAAGSTHIEYDKSNWQQRTIAQISICAYGGNRVAKILDSRGRVSRRVMSVGTNQSFRKKTFDEVNGFDTNLTAGMEKDILLTIEKAGYRIAFVPEAIVYVRPRSTILHYLKQAFHRSSGGVVNQLKHPSQIGISYIFNAGFLPLLAILLPFSFIIENTALSYLSLAIIAAPVIFYALKIIRAGQHFKNPLDVLLVVLLGYAAFLTTATGIISGICRYIAHASVRS